MKHEEKVRNTVQPKASRKQTERKCESRQKGIEKVDRKFEKVDRKEKQELPIVAKLNSENLLYIYFNCPSIPILILVKHMESAGNI